LVVVSFNIAVTASANSTPLSFGDQPVAREVVDASANSLTTAYTPGMVAITIAPGFEADVAPRPNGSNDGTVTVADWTQAGRFATGLDSPMTGGEFQRADCAPKESKGNGQLTIADWVQAGRFAVGLDPVVSAGGPTGPFALALSFTGAANPMMEAAAERVLRAVNTSFTRGQQGSVSIELDAQGNENAFGFSLTFDPTQLSFVSAAAGADVPGGAGFNLNTNQAASGRLVIALALPAGQTFAAGTRRVVTVTFAVASSGSANSTAIGFSDQPMAREVVDAQANILPTTYASGAVTLIRPAVSVSAANYTSALASESIVAAFGTNLATRTEAATALPLPTALAGTSVKIKDSAGGEQLAPLFFVSFGQVNYHLPPGTAPGTATITITSGDGAISTGTIEIVAVAPGLFTFNADGRGVPAGYALRLRGDQLLAPEPIAQLDGQNRWVTRPLDLGPESDQVFLVLFGTGVRYRSDLAAVMAGIGGGDEQVLYAGIAPGFIGLDQTNVRLSRRLLGRGEVDVEMTVDGRRANTVRINIK
jgi:uncharacterized protein (TIGR03437 family)